MVLFKLGLHFLYCKYWYCIVRKLIRLLLQARSAGILKQSAPGTRQEPLKNPSTRAQGTGMVRVKKSQPTPVPLCTLPKTRTGLKTLDDP